MWENYQVLHFAGIISLGEVDISDVKDGREELEEAVNILGGQVHDSQGKLEGLIILLIMNGFKGNAARLVDVMEFLRGQELEPFEKKRKERRRREKVRKREIQLTVRKMRKFTWSSLHRWHRE